MKKIILSLSVVTVLALQSNEQVKSRIEDNYHDIPAYFDIKNTFDKKNLIPIAIIGGGPAGYTAALYAARAKMNPVVFTTVAGGQLIETSEVENWPGVKKMQGFEIMQNLREQAEEAGAIIKEGVTVTRIVVKENGKPVWPIKLETSDGMAYAMTVIIATGASHRKLGIPGEMEYLGKGVSPCAVCDCRFFKNKNVYVVGGGDHSMEQLMQLAPHVKSATLLVRKNRLRAVRSMQDKIKEYPNVRVEFNKEVLEILGNGKSMTGLRIRNTETNKISIIPAEGLFLAIGQNPNTDLFKDILELTKDGYIKLQEGTQATSIPGIFAAGDVEDAQYRQAITACGKGCAAALSAVALNRDAGLTEVVEKRLRSLYYTDSKRTAAAEAA